jgi:hypothetical protein
MASGGQILLDAETFAGVHGRVEAVTQQASAVFVQVHPFISDYNPGKGAC